MNTPTTSAPRFEVVTDLATDNDTGEPHATWLVVDTVDGRTVADVDHGPTATTIARRLNAITDDVPLTIETALRARIDRTAPVLETDRRPLVGIELTPKALEALERIGGAA